MRGCILRCSRHNPTPHPSLGSLTLTLVPPSPKGEGFKWQLTPYRRLRRQIRSETVITVSLSGDFRGGFLHSADASVEMTFVPERADEGVRPYKSVELTFNQNVHDVISSASREIPRNRKQDKRTRLFPKRLPAGVPCRRSEGEPPYRRLRRQIRSKKL